MLRHAILVFNPIQNPDGRVAGTRANGNGFDLNRDYLTQSQSETRASIDADEGWLPPEMLDLHGYVSPTLIEATTKPHNPSIEYDLWLKWNQPRIDANEAAVNAIGKQRHAADQRLVRGRQPGRRRAACVRTGARPGPPSPRAGTTGARSIRAMYRSTSAWTRRRSRCASRVADAAAPTPSAAAAPLARRPDRRPDSTFDFVVGHREGMLHDELEIYRRGDEDAPRPSCCPPPFDVDNNWMLDYPKAYVIPVGRGQRSDAEANRLVEWLLFNDIEVTELTRDYTFSGQTFEAAPTWRGSRSRGAACSTRR